MPIDRRLQAQRAMLGRWLPEGMEPTPDLVGMAEAAADALVDAALLPGVPLPDADQTTTEILDRIKAAIAGRQLTQLAAIGEEVGSLVARVIAAEAERDRVVYAYAAQDQEIEQRVAAALGYPRYPADWPTYHTLDEQTLAAVDAVRTPQHFEVGNADYDPDVWVFAGHARVLADALTAQDRCVGEHVPLSLVAQLCRRYAELQQAAQACSQILAATREAQ